MESVVRLPGDDAAVRAVSREAVEVLQQSGSGGELFPALWNLQDRRRRFIATARARTSVSVAEAQAQAGRAYRALWSVLLGVGLVAAVAAASMLGPADRKNQYTAAGSALAVAQVAGAVALLVLLLVLVLRVPEPSVARVGEGSAVVVGILCAAMLMYRLVAGTSDGRGFTAPDLATWVPMMAVIVLLMVGIVLRCDPVRRRGASACPASVGGRPSDVNKELRRTAERLASLPDGKAAAADWRARLGVLEQRGVDARSVAQARTMTPSAWLAWLAYDGEISLAGVVPR